jgi:hypothetical protein
MNPFAPASNPFGGQTAAPATPAVAAPAAPVVNGEATETKKRGRKAKDPNAAPGEKKERRTLAKLTKEDRIYIINNYAQKDRKIVAQELSAQHGYEIVAQQVYNVVNAARKEITEELEAAKAAGNGELVQKLQWVLDNKLVSKPFGFAKGESAGPRAKKETISSFLDELMK